MPGSEGRHPKLLESIRLWDDTGPIRRDRQVLPTAYIFVHLPQFAIPEVKAIHWQCFKRGLGSGQDSRERRLAVRRGGELVVEVDHTSSELDRVFPECG